MIAGREDARLEIALARARADGGSLADTGGHAAQRPERGTKQRADDNNARCRDQGTCGQSEQKPREPEGDDDGGGGRDQQRRPR